MLDSVTVSLLAFAAAAGLLTLTPGVDTAIVLRSAASLGQRAGAAAAAGVCAGLFIWGAGAALGLGALLAASAKAYLALKWVGAAYLVYLGVQLWRSTQALSSGGTLSHFSVFCKCRQ